MDPIKFVILWLAVGFIGNIITIFLDWLNGSDLHLKDITWCVLISLMGFFVPLMIIAFLISESVWWFKFTQKISEFWKKSGAWVVIKGHQAKRKNK